MPAREVVYLLLLTANPDLVELYRQDCPECVVTIAKDAASVVRKAPKHRFDAVIIESRKDWAIEMKLLNDALGGTPSMVLVGSTTFLRRATEPLKALCNGHKGASRHNETPSRAWTGGIHRREASRFRAPHEAGGWVRPPFAVGQGG